MWPGMRNRAYIHVKFDHIIAFQNETSQNTMYCGSKPEPTDHFTCL